MTSLFLPSRRGFLGVLAGALAAPLVVRAESLMPVRWVDMAFGPITPQQQANEMNRLLRAMGVKSLDSPIGGFYIGKQSHVDMWLGYLEYSPIAHVTSFDDRSLPLAEYSNRYLYPIAQSLREYIGQDKVAGRGLTLPEHVAEAALCDHGGIQVRVITDYCIRVNAMVTRFDIRHT